MYEEDGENKFGFCTISLPDSFPTNTLQDIWFCIVTHDANSKQFTLNIYNEDGEFAQHTTDYKGKLINYSGTPYNFGCGNYYKQVDDTHYFFGDYSLGNAGLLETVKHTDEEILTFVENNNDSFTSLKKDGKLSDMVFYFKMLNQNRYKVWDLTEHCNFLMYNVDVFK